MKACDDCLRRSILQNESAGFAERGIGDPAAVRRLLALGADEQLDALRRHMPRIDASLSRRVRELRDDLPERHGLWMTCLHDVGYPRRFEPLEHDRPVVLYGIGRPERFAQLVMRESVAIVGARRASGYGRELAYTLASELSAIGVWVVSGMALGIDGAAHRGALGAGGRTAAVLAGGPELPYPPSHRRLHEQIALQGVVVSERPPGSRSRRWGFPLRNRLIAAFSDLTIMVEGTEKSGAKYTVDAALDLGRCCAAVPGPVTSPLSAGPNQMLIEGALMVRDARDVVDQLFHVGARPEVFGDPPDARRLGLNPRLTAILDRIAAGDGTAQKIASGSPELTPREIVRALGELEMTGWIERDATGGYRQATIRSPRSSGSDTR
ncbi:MAG: DNA-processing protein DprA [Solirubrobacterales bacterium]